MLVSAPSGWLSDRYGERVAIVGGFLLASGSLWIFVNVQAFSGFALAAMVLGVGLGVIGPAYDALVSKITPQNLRGLAFGFFQTSLGVVSLPAPWVGAQLWERIGPSAPFTLTALAALLAGLLAWTKFKLPQTMTD
jgi:MFS family permease